MSVLCDGLELDDEVLALEIVEDDADGPAVPPLSVAPDDAAPLVSLAPSGGLVVDVAAVPSVLLGALVDPDDPADFVAPLELSTSMGDSGGSMGAESALNSADKSRYLSTTCVSVR